MGRLLALRTLRLGRFVVVVHPLAWVRPRASGAWPATWKAKGWLAPIYRWTLVAGTLQLRREPRSSART